MAKPHKKGKRQMKANVLETYKDRPADARIIVAEEIARIAKAMNNPKEEIKGDLAHKVMHSAIRFIALQNLYVGDDGKFGWLVDAMVSDLGKIKVGADGLAYDVCADLVQGFLAEAAGNNLGITNTIEKSSGDLLKRVLCWYKVKIEKELAEIEATNQEKEMRDELAELGE